MAVVENASGSSTLADPIGGGQTNVSAVAGDNHHQHHHHHQPQSNKMMTAAVTSEDDKILLSNPLASTDRSSHNKPMVHQQQQNTPNQNLPAQNSNGTQLHRDVKRNGGVEEGVGDDGIKKEIRELEEMLSKLNPMAEEFVPPSLTKNNHSLLQPPSAAEQFGYKANSFVSHDTSGISNGNPIRRKKNFYMNAKRRMNSRTSMAQREEVIRRTVYVSDIDNQVTEEQLAALFLHCGQVVDCRICGDPNSVLRFAFIEFTDEEGASSALNLAGTVLGFYPVKVLPSKTAIAPVNPTFLPRSEDEREMCARTIYCTNIDKKVTHAEIKLFFESICGEVQRLRLLGDFHHSTRIAFVEFIRAESAIAALNCSGAILGSLPLRVSPSKTPVRPRPPRPYIH